MSSVTALRYLLPPEFQLISATQVVSLWSNYGHIYRLRLASEPGTLILKSIHPPDIDDSSESNVRKLLSYHVERWFYQHLSSQLPPDVKMAKSYSPRTDHEHNLLLEDLSVEFAFPARGSLGKDATIAVLKWLAGFHRTFFGIHQRPAGERPPVIPPPAQWKTGLSTSGIWERGTYWYLDTRREELEETDEHEYSWLLPWVEKINDAVNREAKDYGTLLHGDVKGANILFDRDPYGHHRGKNQGKTVREGHTSSSPLRCALYDLQYVGLGLGTYDLVYFFATSVESSLLTPASEKELLGKYLALFHASAADTAMDPTSYNFDVLWRHWELAIVDWYRFMAGWGFWGNDRWVARRAREIVAERIQDLVSD